MLDFNRTNVNIQIFMNDRFTELYRSNWLHVIDTEPLISVRSRMAQRILKMQAVDILRRRELKEVEYPKWYITRILNNLLP